VLLPAREKFAFVCVPPAWNKFQRMSSQTVWLSLHKEAPKIVSKMFFLRFGLGCCFLCLLLLPFLQRLVSILYKLHTATVWHVDNAMIESRRHLLWQGCNSHYLNEFRQKTRHPETVTISRAVGVRYLRNAFRK